MLDFPPNQNSTSALEGKTTNSENKISLCIQHNYFYQLRSLLTSHLLLLQVESIKVNQNPRGMEWVGYMCLSCVGLLLLMVLTGPWEAVLSDPFYV